MKLLPLLLAVATLLCLSCSRSQSGAEEAATRLYNQYASASESLTVAYIGNYQAYGHRFNAVMFQAADSSEWQWLKKEFGVIEPGDLSLDARGQDNTTQPGGRVTMVTLHIDTSIQFQSPEQRQAYIDSITQATVAEILGSRQGDTGSFVATLDAHDTNLSPELQSQMEQIKQMEQNTRADGSDEYVISVDSKNRTLWLFFCNNPDEMRTLGRWLHSKQH